MGCRQTPWAKEPSPARTNMIYTSGTTGRPKGVRLLPTDAEMMSRTAAPVARIFDLRPDQPAMRVVITGSVYRAAPKFFYVLYAAQSSGLVILQPRFDAADAAAPCPPEVKRRMIEWWGPVNNEYYAGMETGVTTFYNSQEALAKPGTVGRAMKNREVVIQDKDGKALPPEEIGESLCTHVLLETGSDLTVDSVRTYLGQHMATTRFPR